MAPNVPDPRSLLLALRKRVVQFLFLYLMTVLFCVGIVLIIAYEAWHLHDLWRDLGVSMLVAGTVGLGVELFSRREMEKVLGEMIEQKLALAMDDRWKSLETSIQKIDQEGRERRRLQENVLPQLAEIRDLVVRESGLQDVGLKRLAPHREDKLLTDFLERAKPGNSIRVLALCLNTLANHSGKDLFKRKLRQGCRIRLLLLDPAMDMMLAERATQEETDIQAFTEQVRTWNSFHKSMAQELSTDESSPGSIELGYYQSLPSCFLVDDGSSMVVGFYLQGCRGDQCPHLEIEHKQNGLYQQFDRHFEALWARRIPPFDRRQKNEAVENERRGLRIA